MGHAWTDTHWLLAANFIKRTIYCKLYQFGIRFPTLYHGDIYTIYALIKVSDECQQNYQHRYHGGCKVGPKVIRDFPP